MSFAVARGVALGACLTGIPHGLLTKPNNGLAIEYCKAVFLLGNPMEVFTTHRGKGGPSATKIRAAFRHEKSGSLPEQAESIKGLLPDFAYEILLNAKDEIAELDDYSDIFKYLLYSTNISLGEGLENRFKRLCGRYPRISEMLNAVKTKRYTYTRLQRKTIGLILGITTSDMDFYESHGGVQYIRVLGFRRDSADLLGEMAKKATLPVITHGAAMDNILSSGGAAGTMLAKELEAGDIYRIATGTVGGFLSERGVGMVVI